MDKIQEQQFRNERKEEKREEEEESSWGCLARPDGARSSKKEEGSACQGIPRPAVHAAQDDGKHWRTSYDLSQKLDALRYSRQKSADGGEV